MTNARKLRELLASGRMVRAPGAYDAITARLAEQAGFSCLYMTGPALRWRAATPISAC